MRTNVRDLTGKRIGHLRVVRIAKPHEKRNRKSTSAHWMCRCVCGKRKVFSGGSLHAGGAHTSCGCLRYKYVSKALSKQRKGKLKGPAISIQKRSKFGRLSTLGPYRRNRKTGNYEWECLCKCGNRIWVAVALLKSGNTKSCGCLRKDQMGALGRAKRDPKISETERRKRRLSRVWSDPRWAEISASVKKRDNFTCRVCGKRGSQELHVHHVKSWSKYRNLRYDPQNCETVCKSCHVRFHRLYGYRNATKRMWRKFKNEH